MTTPEAVYNGKLYKRKNIRDLIGKRITEIYLDQCGNTVFVIEQAHRLMIYTDSAFDENGMAFDENGMAFDESSLNHRP